VISLTLRMRSDRVRSMRGSRDLSRGRTAPGCRASAWLVLAALLGLWLTQPLHVSLRVASQEAAALSAAASHLAGSTAAPHDAGACQICRTAAQTRTGLRSLVHVSAGASAGPSVRTERPSQLLPTGAPLRDTWPRAPPTTRVVLDS
jgi:hypothetical protein